MDVQIDPKPGDNCDRKSQNGDSLHVQYTVILRSTGKVIETTRHYNQPFVFTNGHGVVCKEWDNKLLNMHVGEQRRFEIQHSLVCPLSGAGNGVPVGDAFLYDVELVKIIHGNKEVGKTERENNEDGETKSGNNEDGEN